MTPPDVAIAVAAVTNGLLAGLLFSFACAVTVALRRVDDVTYVDVFRKINVDIVNGWFLLVFLTAPLSAVTSAVLTLQAQLPVAPWVVGAAVASLLTVIITAAANIPLNRKLESAPTGTAAQSHDARRDFERPWNTWNAVRTLTSIAALVLFTVAALS